MSIISSSICELMMKIYCKYLGLSTSIYDIQALKGVFVFAVIWGELVEMVKQNETNNIILLKGGLIQDLLAGLKLIQL